MSDAGTDPEPDARSGPTDPVPPLWIGSGGLQSLVELLREGGHRVLGPVERDGSLAFAPVEHVEQLARGRRDVQAPGHYRLEDGDPARFFDAVNGAGGLKPLVFAPREPLLQIESEGVGRPFQARSVVPEPEPVAVLGVRACDLAGLAVQDRIFLHDRYPDPQYASRRRGLVLVAVACTRAAPTCFCDSVGTGPAPTRGFDLSLTELDGGFLVRSGSPVGDGLRDALAGEVATTARLESERSALEACRASMERSLSTEGLPRMLYERLDHPRWDEVGERCLGCGNCTLVCPTCFCHDEWDESDPSGRQVTRVREWDSCFDRAHSQVHGINFRPSIRDRYRQWLVHKLASWIDQFGTSGCVGCGRCISWCPVGIDLTDEMRALRKDAP